MRRLTLSVCRAAKEIASDFQDVQLSGLTLPGTTPAHIFALSSLNTYTLESFSVIINPF